MNFVPRIQKTWSAYIPKKIKTKEKSFIIRFALYYTSQYSYSRQIRYIRFLHTLTRKYFYVRLMPFTSDIRIQASYSITTSIIKSPSP